ncbi:alpha-glycosidase [Domibacillus indicus]|uniref:glycoside hydrolase family 13 protein n=1 Tax=Domibacillus indicus TaxID=1437523 RepID=UPI0020412FEB|nr:glycoside hydrolase family 13 protein [Domibacillus indicus]MCM3789922.1 alpha-glycosidase [Domibacillus indicus]
MFKEAIYHRPKNNFAYSYDPDTVHIRLRCKKGDLTHVSLLHGDSYILKDGIWVYDEEDMILAGSDMLFDYWMAEIKPAHRRLLYGFKCVSGDETIYYTERGFFDQAPEKTANYFNFPYINPADIFTAPRWVKDTVWYQIFPERFGNGDPRLNPPNTQPWGGKPEFDNYFGGDFQGVIDHLDYLQDLGITGIYFTPIFKANTNHKYDTIDYLQIDPQFGDEALLRKLIDECHQRGIKVMLDAVFNHSGYFFGPFQDVLEKGEASKYKDWFHIRKFPLQEGDQLNYETFSFEKNMPKLNTENREVKDYLLNVASHWVKNFDIDGWRLDVADEVDHAFWREFRRTVKAIKPDVYILGEIWHDALPWLQGDQFDAAMNYRFVHAIVDFFAQRKITAEQFKQEITHVYHSYPIPINEVAFNLLGSHDTPRLLTVAYDNKESVKLSYLFALSSPGSPCIYYGDEIGLTGGPDPDCRKCMVWDEDKQDRDLRAFIQKAIALRKQIPAFGNSGSFAFADIHPELISYTRENKQEKLLFLINSSDTPIQADVPDVFMNARNVWTEETHNEKTVVIQPQNFVILHKTMQ